MNLTCPFMRKHDLVNDRHHISIILLSHKVIERYRNLVLVLVRLLFCSRNEKLL